MKSAHASDTIVAIATPIGEGGLSVVRISGPDALTVAAKGFRGKADLTTAPTHSAHFGSFYSGRNIRLDDVVALVFRGPNSYTGENAVEITCHGGMYVTRRILEALLEYGCRLAEPGEFTKRAFLNGKMDLSQAEAVADLIHARSEKAREASVLQLTGRLSARIDALRTSLIGVSGKLELELDFAEEGYEFAGKKQIEAELESTISQVGTLLKSYQTGKIYREGVKLVLAGMPNVGKSSLLNALLMENRAIVTEVPGTTRDTIEESLVIEGLLFRIVDTAGLRETIDRVESEGVRRSQDQVKSSDMLLLVMDGSKAPEPEEMTLARRLIQDVKRVSTPALVVMNKMDLVNGKSVWTDRSVESLEARDVARISALTGEGLEDLRKTLVRHALGSPQPTESTVTITNARHFEALRKTKERLVLAKESLDAGQSGEFLAVDLRGALDRLGEITGAITTDDILDEVFSKFCIGK